MGDDTNEPRVRRYDVEGRLLDTLALLDVRRAPGDEDRRRIEAELEALVGREAATRRALAAIGEPERTPAFEDLFADDDGRLWTLAHDAAGDWRAIVYAGGRPVARLALPPHLEVLDIRDGWIAVRAAGALEEDIVRVYAFHEP